MDTKYNDQALEWQKEADVVIVGYGAAGAAAAIAAHDAGSSVIIVESMARGGGNTLVSMGGFLCPENVEDAVTYITALYDMSHSEKDEKVIRSFAEEAVKNIKWVKGLKENTKVHIYGHASYPQLPGSQSINKYLIRGARKGSTAFAENLWDVLTYAVEEKKAIPVLTQTPARRLLMNNVGEITGIIVETNEREAAIKARKAVILTTGGYEYDSGFLKNHVRGFPIYASGSPGNKGDGIRMAQKAGAALWHMNAVSCWLGIKVPEFESGFLVMISAPGYIIVDKSGRRFMNEHDMEIHSALLYVDCYDNHSMQYPRIPCFAVFDEKTRVRGPISRAAGLGSSGKAYSWSKDNSVEIEKGWILKGQTVEELARRMDVSPQAMSETVAQWNADIQNGKDTIFGRPIQSALKSRPIYEALDAFTISEPLQTPPFYAMALYPCLINTQGGPRRNEFAQVLDSFGMPVRRLYSAGELGSMWGTLYQGAGNLGECLAFGRIAGKCAAGEVPSLCANER